MDRFLTVPLCISSFTRSVMNNILARSNLYLPKSSLSLYSPSTSHYQLLFQVLLSNYYCFDVCGYVRLVRE